MSAKMIIPQAEADQGFGLLKDIVEMVKNPKAIDEAYERRRKGAQLTEDEIKKAEDARALIAKADTLRKEIQDGKDANEQAKKDHENTVALHNQYVQKKNQEFADWQNKLDGITAEQAQKDIEQANAKKALDNYASQIADDHAAWENAYNEKADKQAAIDIAQKAEGERLTQWAAKLKAKAARVAAEAQSDV